MTATAWSLLDWLAHLARDRAAQADMARDPEGFLRAHGFEGLRAEDIHYAIPLVADIIAAGAGGNFDASAAAPSPIRGPGESELHAAFRQIHFLNENTQLDDAPLHRDGLDAPWFDDVLGARQPVVATHHLGVVRDRGVRDPPDAAHDPTV